MLWFNICGKQTCRVGQNHIYIYIYIYSVCTVFLAGKSPNIRPYTVYIYCSGQPYRLGASTTADLAQVRQQTQCSNRHNAATDSSATTDLDQVQQQTWIKCNNRLKCDNRLKCNNRLGLSATTDSMQQQTQCNNRLGSSATTYLVQVQQQTQVQ